MKHESDIKETLELLDEAREANTHSREVPTNDFLLLCMIHERLLDISEKLDEMR